MLVRWLVVLLLACPGLAFPPCALHTAVAPGGDPALVLSNGFVRLVANTARPSLVSLKADFLGGANFSGAEVLASDGLRLESVAHDGTVSSSADAVNNQAKLRIVSNTSELVSISISGVVDHVVTPSATETWVLTLHRDARSFEFNSTGTRLSSDPGPSQVRRAFYLNAESIYAFFGRGVVQMKNADVRASAFGSTDTLPRVYALGGGSAIDINRVGSDAGRGVVLLSSGNGKYLSGIHEVLDGSFPKLDQWSDGALDLQRRDDAPLTQWQTAVVVTPNDRNFPAGGLTTGPNIPIDDLEALMTGIYASSPGCLCTYDNEVKAGVRVAQIATTIATPGRGYSGTYNYFDPDNFISLSAMIYSGDEYLQRQARDVIMRSGAFLRVSNDSLNGELPHHFVDDKPTYAALSGAIQTGPNTFWTKAALQYARNSGDFSWLSGYLPKLRNASDYCFNLVEAKNGLLNAPGSLMIDVFVRGNYTSDSNAMMAGFLREMAAAEEALGDKSRAKRLDGMSERMAAMMNRELWAPVQEGADHFVTQVNPDGTYRDFVDYDSNLIALAHGVPNSTERQLSLLKRVDRGRCSAAQGGGPQFVSEKWYGPHDTTGGNVGDSWCSMGRIAWFDAHARKLMGRAEDLASFDASLGVLQRDLIADTWMHERYGCDGKQQSNRTWAYFEYPSVVAMLLREVRYGIRLDWDEVIISPFGPTSFAFHVGNVNVDFSWTAIAISVPGAGSRRFTVDGVMPSSSWIFSLEGTACATEKPPSGVTSSSAGKLVFSAPVGTGCLLRASAPSDGMPASATH